MTTKSPPLPRKVPYWMPTTSFGSGDVLRLVPVSAREREADDRYSNVADERRDDLAERTAGDDADGEVDDAALQREGLEVAEERQRAPQRFSRTSL